MRIIFFISSSDRPIGGNKVIYRYVQELNKQSISAFVMHTIKNFKCTWLDEEPSIINPKYFQPEDHIIFTEMGISRYYNFIIRHNLQFSIFVQNGYHLSTGVFDGDTREKVKKLYNKASYVFSISEDTSDSINTFLSIPKEKIIRMQYYRKISVFDKNKTKSNLITYMPRKNYEHAHKVLFGLMNQLPKDWRIKPIINMTDKQLRDTMDESKIFLAFSSFEGLPAPPIEAAFAKNFVVGYHGQGGLEYWEEPVFSVVEPFNVKSFISKILKKISYLEECSTFPFEDFNKFCDRFQHLFSKEGEINCLKKMSEKISVLAKGKDMKKIPNKLQKNKYTLEIENRFIGLERRLKNKARFLEK